MQLTRRSSDYREIGWEQLSLGNYFIILTLQVKYNPHSRPTSGRRQRSGEREKALPGFF